MNAVYIFLVRWDIPIYFVCGVGLLISLFQWGRARRILRQAMFSLEQEHGRALQSSALTFIIILSVTLLAVLYVNLRIVPTLPAELLSPPTPTPDIFATPLTSPTPLNPDTILGTSEPRTTPVLAPTATLPNERLQPTLPPSNLPSASNSNDVFIPEGGGCTPAINISQPRPNATVLGTVEFVGSATAPEFGFYLLEIRGAATNNTWVNILGDSAVTPVSNGPLGATNLTSLPNDNYEVRLTVLDGVGEPIGRCLITIQLDNQ